MNCREFLAEFEERRALSQTATLHLNDCPGCQKTSREQTRVWQMIEGMKRIDAPNDFDFRVKAKIANAQPADFQPLQPRFFPALRYVLPLGLIVLVLGVLAFNTSLFFGNNASPQLVENVSPNPIAGENLPSNLSLSEQPGQIISQPQSFTNEEITAESFNQNFKPANNERETEFIVVKSIKKQATKPSNVSPKEDFKGVNERSATYKEPITPENINPTNKTVEKSPNPNNLNPVTDEQILSFIGIETVSENGRKKVKAVKSDSLAERSGVKAGDVIEAIDGKQIGGEPIRMETSESRKLTVVRGAEKKEIVLQNKSN